MSRSLSAGELERLASHADARNRTIGIVGVLYVAGRRLLQVLEGERAPVRWLYRQIALDPRHQRIAKLMDSPIERRVFFGWHMRILYESDLQNDSRIPVAEAMESALVFDTDNRLGLSDSRDLQALPAALARGVVGRDRLGPPLEAGSSPTVRNAG